MKNIQTEKAKIAHHSIWNQKVAGQMLKKFEGDTFSRKYPVRKPLRVTEAIRRGMKAGQWVTDWRTANTVYCYKRFLYETGKTRPYRDIQEYDLVKKTLKIMPK